MHEASLVESLLRQLAELTAERHSPVGPDLRVTEVRVEIGPLAGVEPLLFREAFGRLRQGTLAEAAELEIELVGLSCRCRGCSHLYQVPEPCFVCPRCQWNQIDLLSGDAVLLVSFTLTSAGCEAQA